MEIGIVNELQTCGAESERKFDERINPVPEGHRGKYLKRGF